MDWLRLTPGQILALVRAGLILAGALLAHLAAARLVAQLRERSYAMMSRREGAHPGELRKQADTLAGIAGKGLRMVIWLAAALAALRQLGFDMTPVLASAGVAGLAIGLGARTLVRDVVSGAFLLVENQIRVGDVAEINGQRGMVAEMNLRTTVLRSGDGVVHVFENGLITRLANVTRGFSCFVLDVPVSLREDPDRVLQLLREVGEELRQEEAWAGAVLEPMEILGLDRFEASSMVLRARLRTAPGQQLRAGRELNRRLKRRMDDAGIRFALPHRTLYFGEASPPLKVQWRRADGA